MWSPIIRHPQTGLQTLALGIIDTTTGLSEVVLVLHHHRRHSYTSMTFSPRAYLSGVIVLFAAMKTCSHSVAVAGQDK
jgi:hypothetical protein